MGNEYKFIGKLELMYKNALTINFNQLKINNNSFPSALNIIKGSINIEKEQIKIKKLNIESDWFISNIDGTYHHNDITKTSGMIIIDRLEYLINGQHNFNIYNYI